jgi:hypothetical protein
MSTSIRVSKELHERLVERAHAQHVSLSDVIQQALDAQEDTAFWSAVRSTMGNRGPRASLESEVERAAPALKDGLDPDERWDDVL